MGSLRLWLIILGVSAVIGTVATYVVLCQTRAVKLEQLQARQSEWLAERSALNRELTSRNQRIRDLNQRQLEVIAAADQRRRDAEALAEQVRVERDQVTERLARVLADLATEAETNAELAQWSVQPVPAVAWDGLRDLASSPEPR
jgi:uncharacterized membrane protein